MMDSGSQVLTGCSAYCHNESRSTRNSCFGIGCCQSIIPHYLKSYTINISRRQDGDDRGCGSAFLVDEYSYVEDNNSYVPVSLLWTLPQQSYFTRVICDGWEATVEVDLGNGNTMKSLKCLHYSGWLGGNPYMYDGTTFTEECARCESSGNYCNHDPIYDADGVILKYNFTCIYSRPRDHKESKISLGVILGNAYSLYS
ncbi:putative wall-associated receptor kinase [Helianthus annuus]|nr:putative wall-associated receptor kinase [Helianthus annuus]